MKTTHIGEIDPLFEEDGSVVYSAMQKARGARPRINLHTNIQRSEIDRIGGTSTDTDLFEIEYLIDLFVRESRETIAWVNAQDATTKNADGRKIAPALNQIRQICRQIIRDSQLLEKSLQSGASASAALLGLQIATAIGKKRFLADDINNYMTGERQRRPKVREPNPERASEKRAMILAAKHKRQRNPSLSKRRLGEILAKEGWLGGKSDETIRKLLKDI